VKPGVELLEDVPGTGAPVAKNFFYDFRLRMWLSRGEPIRWTEPWSLDDCARIEDDGNTLITSLKVERGYMFAGLLYGIEGMRVGALDGFASRPIWRIERRVSRGSFRRMPFSRSKSRW
jgi:hypothetical protein